MHIELNSTLITTIQCSKA